MEGVGNTPFLSHHSSPAHSRQLWVDLLQVPLEGLALELFPQSYSL